MPAKPKLTVEQWAEIRAKRLRQEMTYRALAAEYGVSNVAILKRAKREGWADPTKRPPKPQDKTVDAHRDAYRDGYRDGFRDGLRETMNLRNLASETMRQKP